MLELPTYPIVFVGTFLIGATAAAAAWKILDRQTDPPEPTTPEEPGLLRREVLSTLSVLSALLVRFPYVGKLRTLLAEADMSWSVGRTVLMMLVAGAISLNVVLHLDFFPVLASWMLAAVGAATPIFYIRRRRRKRFQEIEEQLPEALDFVSRSTVAGHSLPMSLELLSDEAGPPLSHEMRKTVDEYNLGLPMSDALLNLARRLPTVDIQFFVSAVVAQSRTGGNLHELLDNLSETIRERGMLKGQVRSMTAHGRLTAVVLSLLPMAVAVAMMLVNPDYFMLLVNHPVGKTLLLMAMCGQLLAYLVIKKIVDIKV